VKVNRTLLQAYRKLGVARRYTDFCATTMQDLANADITLICAHAQCARARTA
jgi:hypothetical protein